MNSTISFSPWLLAALLLTTFATMLPAAAQNRGPSSPTTAASSSYRLNLRNQIEVTVFGEAELSTLQRIDADGQINLGLLNTIVVAGKSVRDAEKFIEQLFVERRFLRQPMVTIRVLEYAPREVLVNGAVGAAGPFVFPAEAASVDIVEVITKSGGFSPIAKSNSVRVTRFAPTGSETFTVPVRDMMTGRTKERFLVFPGDIVWVDESPI